MWLRSQRKQEQARATCSNRVACETRCNCLVPKYRRRISPQSFFRRRPLAVGRGFNNRGSLPSIRPTIAGGIGIGRASHCPWSNPAFLALQSAGKSLSPPLIIILTIPLSSRLPILFALCKALLSSLLPLQGTESRFRTQRLGRQAQATKEYHTRLPGRRLRTAIHITCGLILDSE
jgi:hypothetical protein